MIGRGSTLLLLLLLHLASRDFLPKLLHATARLALSKLAPVPPSAAESPTQHQRTSKHVYHLVSHAHRVASPDPGKLLGAIALSSQAAHGICRERAAFVRCTGTQLRMHTQKEMSQHYALPACTAYRGRAPKAASPPCQPWQNTKTLPCQ